MTIVVKSPALELLLALGKEVSNRVRGRGFLVYRYPDFPVCTAKTWPWALPAEFTVRTHPHLVQVRPKSLWVSNLRDPGSPSF